MNPGRRVGLGLAIVAVLTLAGSAGYMLIERMPFLDALYMTVITITTVGYEEVKPLDTAGRLFTIVIIFVGVGTAYYVFAAVTEVVVSGQFREFVGKSTMNRKIQHLEGHVILCGYGRFGRVVAEELKTDRHIVVVIEINPALEPELVRSGLFYIIGSALDEGVLEAAGIRSASDIVVATASDPDNVFVSLSARGQESRYSHPCARRDRGRRAPPEARRRRSRDLVVSVQRLSDCRGHRTPVGRRFPDVGDAGPRRRHEPRRGKGGDAQPADRPNHFVD